MNARGSVFKYPDNVDTDVIIPARHLNTQDAKELASHCMEDIDKDFVNRVQPGDIMVGGWNFGCGSSREHAPLCIKTAGIAVVIAKSFARIFYRNSINIGLPIMECPEAVDAIEAGDTVQVDFNTGVITDETNGKVFHAEPFPPFYPEHHLRRRPDEGHPEISPSAPTQTVRNPLRHRCAMPPPPKGGGLAHLSVRSIKAPPSGEAAELSEAERVHPMRN